MSPQSTDAARANHAHPCTRRGLFLLLLILGLAAALRIVGIGFGAPAADCRPDEEMVLREALFFWDGDPHVHFHFYPPGMISVEIAWLGVMHVVGAIPRPSMSAYGADPFPFHFAMRILGVVAGTLTVLIVFLTTKRRFGENSALAAALFLAVAPLHVVNSHFGTLDPIGTLFSALTLFFTFRFASEEKTRTLLFAGLAAGFATAIKYPHGAVVLAPLGTLIWRGAPIGVRGRRFSAVAIGGIVGFFLLAPWLLFQFREGLEGLRSQLGEQDKFGSAWDEGLPIFFHTKTTLGHGAGFGVLAFFVLGVGIAVKEKSRALVGLLPFLCLYLLHGLTGLAYPRYLLPIFPVVAIFAGLGVGRVVERFGIWSAILPLVAIIQPLKTSIEFDRALLQKDTRAEFLECFADGRLPKDMPVLTPAWPFINVFPWLWRTNLLEDYSKRDQVLGCKARGEIARRIGRTLSAQQDPQRHPVEVLSVTPQNYEKAAQTFRGRDVLIVIPTSFDPMFEWYGQKRDELLRWNDEKKIEFVRILDIDPTNGAGFPKRTAYDRLDYWFVPFPDATLVPRPGPRIEVYRLRLP